MKNTVKISIVDGELWFSGIIDDTVNMPYDSHSKININTFERLFSNQVNPALISTHGRYLFAEKSFDLQIENGIITVSSDGVIDYGDKDSFLSAYNYLLSNYYPPTGKRPPDVLFTRPQYCTWMALGYNQSQDGVIEFAESILKAGMPAGEIIIDDGWSDYYGDWTFSKYKFPNPKAMCQKLSEMGFKVSVWLVPYVSPDSPAFRELEAKNLLLKRDGKALLAKWWNGYSACVDLTNPDGKAWFTDKIKALTENYGVYGVKMDGGDSYFYGNGVEAYGGTYSGLELSEVYSKIASEFEMSELRACFKCGNLPIMQRIADRKHDWNDDDGFGSIVKRMLVMGLFGYPFNCPDMIGGGLIGDIQTGVCEDSELNIRYMQAATFMPTMQFSKPLWKFGELEKSVVDNMLMLRKEHMSKLLAQADASAKTGYPIAQSIYFKYGVHPEILDQFVIGDDLIVAPVMIKGETSRKVYLPNGEWIYPPTGEIFSGNGFVTVQAPINVLPHFVMKK